MRSGAAVDLFAGAVVGAALGAGAEAGGALLLYTGDGFLGAVGVLLALVLAALGVGVWVGAPAGGAGAVRPMPAARVRGRWVVATVAFLAAAAFAALWAAVASLRQAAFGRALAVLFLLAEPAYASGSLLAALRASLAAARRGEDGGMAAAVLGGAAVGVLAAALVLIPRLGPGSLFLGSAVALAAAGALESRSGAAAERERRGSMDGRVALITGVGGRGQVGYALAESFLAAGWRLVVTGRTAGVEARARELAERGEVVAIDADLTRGVDATRVVETVRGRFGRLDALVNAAGGLTVMKPLAETEPGEWERELARNAETAFVMCRAALPLLRERGGSIVNFASPAGARAVGGLGAYSAAKAAVIALTRALALEEKERGVRANAIAPGMIDTEQNRAAVEDPEAVAWVTRAQVAQVVLFLASEASSGISGETIHVLGEGIT